MSLDHSIACCCVSKPYIPEVCSCPCSQELLGLQLSPVALPRCPRAPGPPVKFRSAGGDQAIVALSSSAAGVTLAAQKRHWLTCTEPRSLV